MGADATEDAAAGHDFVHWYEMQYPGLVRALTVVTGDGEVAQDAASEACARALERWERVRIMDSPDGWVYRVALNVARRRFRRRGLERRLLRRNPVERVREDLVADPRTLTVWDAVARLPERARQAVALRYGADLKEREVADAMQISEGAASSILASARRQLAELLGDEEGVAS